MEPTSLEAMKPIAKYSNEDLIYRLATRGWKVEIEIAKNQFDVYYYHYSIQKAEKIFSSKKADARSGLEKLCHDAGISFPEE